MKNPFEDDPLTMALWIGIGKQNGTPAEKLSALSRAGRIAESLHEFLQDASQEAVLNLFTQTSSK